MASGELGRENLRRALADFAEAIALKDDAYPEFVRDPPIAPRCSRSPPGFPGCKPQAVSHAVARSTDCCTISGTSIEMNQAAG